MIDVEGAGSKAGALYPHVAHVDDGTWWELIQSGASGVGMAAWNTDHITLADLSDYMNGYHPSSWNPVFTPAFVRWQADPYSIQAGLMVRITDFRCFDNTMSDVHGIEHRSMFANLIDGDTIGSSIAGFPGYYLPVWSVVPIDEEYYQHWVDEASYYWDTVTQAQTYYQDGHCFVSEEYEEHYLSWDYDEDGNQVINACEAYIYSHICGREDGAPAGPECGDCEVEDINHDNCTCGLLSYLSSLDTLIDRADPSHAIETFRGVFHDTWGYTLDSHTRGWQNCFDLFTHSDRSPSWFTSFWQRYSPYLARPGHEVPARKPSTISTDSSTPLAS